MKTLDNIYGEKIESLEDEIRNDPMVVVNKARDLVKQITVAYPAIYDSFCRMLASSWQMREEFGEKTDVGVSIMPFFTLIWTLLDAKEEFERQLK